MPYTSFEEMSAPGPQPINSDFVSSDGKFTFRIEGISTYSQREAIRREIGQYQARLAKLNNDGNPSFVVTTAEESFTPSDSHVVAACYLESCVAEPKITSLQWLQFARNHGPTLMEAYERVLINSRIIDDPNVPSAIDEAKEAAQSDPLVNGG